MFQVERRIKCLSQSEWEEQSTTQFTERTAADEELQVKTSQVQAQVAPRDVLEVFKSVDWAT